VNTLRADTDVHNNKGIYEYVLGSKTDYKLLNVRVFDDKTKVAAYEQQTQKAKDMGVSNCPLCAHGDNANKSRTYALKEMDADHVTAWSKGGSTDLTNCEMLCVMHNRSKGNR
jgi:5-methylcytosine-specific restriction endonuclease McrA